MDVTLTLGQMLALGAMLLTIVGLVGPGMYRLGGLTKQVDSNSAQITSLFSKLDALLDELRRDKK